MGDMASRRSSPAAHPVTLEDIRALMIEIELVDLFCWLSVILPASTSRMNMGRMEGLQRFPRHPVLGWCAFAP